MQSSTFHANCPGTADASFQRGEAVDVAYREALQSVERIACPRRSITPHNRPETSNSELIAALLHHTAGNPLETLRQQLRTQFGRDQVFFTPSCRAAIAQVLSLLPQQTVVMPAITCPVVKTAVQVAHKQIEYVDVAPSQLVATSREFERHARPGRILIATHLFGIPTDVDRIVELARSRDCLVIEDAAAAFGAAYKGRMLGTFGDFGVLSFERSKRVPAFRGGVLVANNESILDGSRLNGHRPVPTSTVFPLRELLFAAVYNVATRPWLFGRVVLPKILNGYTRASEPQSCANESVSSPFYTHEFHAYQAELVLRQLRRSSHLYEHVAALASRYRAAFGDTELQLFATDPQFDSGLLRFPVAFRGMNRAEALRRALARGLYLETNFEEALPDPAEHRNFPHAVWAAAHLVLLPLYRRLSIRHAEELANAVVEIQRGVRAHAA